MDDGRLVIFCLVPERLKNDVLGDLQAHFAHDDRVHVILERRQGQRRASARGGLPSRSAEEELEDRRSGRDRRRPVLPRWFDQLPPELAARATGIRFVQRMLPVSGSLTGLEVQEIVNAVRSGNPEAPTELYWRVYERIHSRLCVLLGDATWADRMAPDAFGRVIDALEADDGGRPFDPLLYEAIDAAYAAQKAAAEEGADETGHESSLALTDPTLDEPVRVEERDPRWFQRGLHARERILRSAGDHVIAVEHIGSTGVPAIAARPIVDILVGVQRMQEPTGLRQALTDMGFERCGDGGTKGRGYYRQRGVLNYDVHVVRYDGPLWRDAIALREHLRSSPSDAARWAAAKREAARAGGDSLLKYAELRQPALRDLLARAAVSSQRAA